MNEISGKWYHTSRGSCKYPGEKCPGRTDPERLGSSAVHGTYCFIDGIDPEVQYDYDPTSLKDLEELYG